MDFERTLEIQRLKLLRIVAGLVVVVGFLSVGPVSRGFSVWVCGFVVSILSRAEAAARCLVFAQAGAMIAREGLDVDRSQFSASLSLAFSAGEAKASVSECRERLKVLSAVLMDLPRHASGLIRRALKRVRLTGRARQILPRLDPGLPVSLRNWRLSANRVERPPDKRMLTWLLFLPPPEIRAGGVCAWTEQ